MRIQYIVIIITGICILNAYHDGKYFKLLMTYKQYKKYYEIVAYGFIGLCAYLLFSRNPTRGREMLKQANTYIKYIPINSDAKKIINPILDFTSNPNTENVTERKYNERLLSSGTKGSKRSVSETKKKYVASQQKWKCEDCQQQLDHTFEIDHRVRLEYGGGNNVENLVALCRNCHGKKTASENM